MEYFRCWICIVFQWNTLLLVLQAWAVVDLHTECGLRPWATPFLSYSATFLLSSHSLSRVVNSWPLFFALCAISLLLFSFSPPLFCLPFSVFHPPTSASAPHNNIIRVSPLVPQEASPFTNSCNAECPYTWLTSIWTSPRLSSRRSKIGQSAMRDFSFADMCRHQWSSSPTYWGQRPERGGMDDGGKAGLFEGMKGRVYWSVVWHAVCRFWS